VDDVTCVRTVCQLYKAFATPENGVDPSDEGNYETMIELWFQFAIIWGIGGCLDAVGRRKYGPCCVGTSSDARQILSLSLSYNVSFWEPGLQ
jgi:hypothetical protein